MKYKMEHKEKINYMRIASGMAGFSIQNKHLDLLVSLYEYVLEKQGDGNLREIISIESEAKKRDDIEERTKMLDKVSKKRDQ